MPPLSLWTRHAKQHVCRCSRVVVQYPKHQPHRCEHSHESSMRSSPRAPSTANRDDSGVMLFRITEISSVRLSSISVNPKPTKPHKERHLRKSSTSIFTSSMRSLHMAKDKLKAKLHAVGIAGAIPPASGSSSCCRPARAFSSDSGHHSSASRQMRSNSLGRGVFRSRRGSGGHQGGKGPVPLTPSSSMIFIDCPE